MAQKVKNHLVSIIFVYYNTPKEIVNALSSVKSSIKEHAYEIIIIDNCSSKPLSQSLKSLPEVRIIKNKKNVGYGKALNQGAKIAKGRYLLLANSDLIFLEDSVDLMLKKLEGDSTIGIIGPQFLDNNHKVQLVGSDMPFLPRAFFAFSFLNKFFPKNFYSKQYYLLDFDRKTEREVPAICGASFIIRKSVFEKINGFDERFFMYFEEADICYRVKNAGFKVLYYPVAKVIHLIGKSSSDKRWIQGKFEESRYKFFKKYHSIVVATLGEALLRFFGVLGGII